MQMTVDLNGDGGRHKAQLETEREREIVGELSVSGGQGGGGREEKRKKHDCLMPT